MKGGKGCKESQSHQDCGECKGRQGCKCVDLLASNKDKDFKLARLRCTIGLNA